MRDFNTKMPFWNVPIISYYGRHNIEYKQTRQLNKYISKSKLHYYVICDSSKWSISQFNDSIIVRQIRWGDRQSMTTILRQLHWLPVRKRIDFKLLVLCAQGHIQWHAGVSCGTATPPHTSPFAALCRRFTARGAQSQPGTFRPPCICLCRTHSVEHTSKEHRWQQQHYTVQEAIKGIFMFHVTSFTQRTLYFS